MKKCILIIAALLLFGQVALASDTNYDVCYGSLDSDYDDNLSKGEFMTAFPNGDMKVYEDADKDKSGGVDHDEWEAWKKSQGLEDDDS